jgi:uncharacterized protein (DUF488 family)
MARARHRPAILTVGHSTRTLPDFLRLLTAHGVRLLVDVRTLPSSRRHPHFGGSVLEAALLEWAIRYVHVPELGGLRRPLSDSRHTGLRNPALRGYADHMDTPKFRLALDRVEEWARADRVALMCAEAAPARCHRSMLADALLLRGHRIEHIRDDSTTDVHRLSPRIRMDGGRVTYAKATRADGPDLFPTVDQP